MKANDVAALDWRDLIDGLVVGRDLSEDAAAAVMGEVMAGKVDPIRIAGLLTALRAKGESPAEIAGFVRAMLGVAAEIELTPATRSRTVDVVGTGGDGAETFNISTLAAVVVAACGQPVAKHGNRAASSLCGSADLLEAWGIDLELDPQRVAESIETIGIGFLFSRSFHPAMRIVAPVRQQLGFRTVFNMLGPLSNPAHVPSMAVGVSDPRLAPVMAEALAKLGKRHALVFRGEDGLDELTTTTASQLWEVRDGEVAYSIFDPRDVGIPRATQEDLRGGDPARNVQIAELVLSGEPGPRRDIVVLNAAAALFAADAVPDLEQGVERAAQALDDGSAYALRDRWVAHAGQMPQAARG